MVPPIDLEPWRASIEAWISEGVTHADVLTRLSTGGCKVALATLQRSLQRWAAKAPTRSYPVDASPELIELIEFAYSKLLITDAETLDLLSKRGFNISIRQLARIRLSRQLYKRVPAAEHAVDDERTMELLLEEYDGGRAEPLGVGNLYALMRARHHIVGRNRMRQIAMEIDPEGFERRRSRAAPRLGVVLAKGPNHVWSMDAHCKLEPFGIQVYAAVDVYSRYVQWLYVGISGRTAVSVLVQYLRTIAQHAVVPEIIRSDRGAETTMAADAHYYLSSCVRPRDDGQPLEFGQCFRYGTSQRLETYWEEQAETAVTYWRGFIGRLVVRGKYNQDHCADRIVSLAIYRQISREVLRDFAELWSHHCIRKQSRRPVATPGESWILYNHP